MNKMVYEDGKYCMQDVGTLYIGCKYTFSELLDDEEIPFKFRLLADRYILPEADLEDTLETHLYYVEKGKFLLRIYRQLKAKVKINILEEKKGPAGQKSMAYTTKVLTVEELAAMPVKEKERLGVVVQEFSVSKLALMAF